MNTTRRNPNLPTRQNRVVGETPQVRIALQVDQEVADWMKDNVKNRNRYIGGLIRQDMERRWVEQLATVRGETVGETMSHLHDSYQNGCRERMD